MDQRQDLYRLMGWFDEVQRLVEGHFDSWSWKIGSGLVGLARRVVGKDVLAVERLRVFRVFQLYNEWRRSRKELGFQGSRVRRGRSGAVLLAGDLSLAPPAWAAGLLADGSGPAPLVVLGFLGQADSIHAGWSEAGVETSVYRSRPLPGLFDELARALMELVDREVLCATGGLESLGLGLMAQFHFGARVRIAPHRVPSQAEGAGTADPIQIELDRIWAQLADASAGEGADPPLAEMAKRLMEVLAREHAACRGAPCAG